MRPPSLDRPSQKVKLLLDREYNVDRDESVIWIFFLPFRSQF